MKRIANIIEAILFVNGNPIEAQDIIQKLSITREEYNNAVEMIKQKYDEISGINLLTFNDKLQFGSNPVYANEIANVLNPIREREMTVVMMETLAIIAYKQPITRTEIESLRGVDCTYAVQVLTKMNFIDIAGRKDTIGKPLLFKTTDEFLKKFNLSSIDELPDYETLLSRIKLINTNTTATTTDLFNSNRNLDYDINEDIPDFLSNEQIEIVV